MSFENIFASRRICLTRFYEAHSGAGLAQESFSGA